DHAENILDAYEWYTSAEGGKRGAAMLGDEMIDEASRKMALVIANKGRAAGMTRTSRWTPPQQRAPPADRAAPRTAANRWIRPVSRCSVTGSRPARPSEAVASGGGSRRRPRGADWLVTFAE